jgi:hypothetical protein
MERERKKIRPEPEIKRQVYEMLNLPGNAWQIVLEKMEMLEIVFAERVYPEFREWLHKRNVWNALFKYKVAPLIRQEALEISQIGLNPRWNCLAWYFSIMGSCEEYLEGYWIRSIKRPENRGEVRLNFQKLLDYTGAFNGIKPEIVEISIHAPDYERIRAHLLDFVSNKNFRTMYSQVIWKIDQNIAEYFKTVAQILYVLLQEGFFIVLSYKDNNSSQPINSKWMQQVHPREGAFTQQAKSHGMSVRQFERHVLANPDRYSATTVRRANLSRNFRKARK